MLYIVLILVLAALGLVVTALVTANSLWAWISIGLSVLAGALLVFDWWRRRSAAGTKPGSSEATEADGEGGGEPTASETGRAEPAAESAVASGQNSATDPSATTTGTARAPRAGAVEERDGDPAEEETDAADLLVVSELDAEVLVVDEHPRYHLSGCDWLEARATIPIAVKEARELGFTPCALCGPDATLASRRRGKRTFRK
ncbi:hypothetical protein FHU38_001632 [Saccharomonospora amisosensis]|uniref:Uncharacterized protein n=1 Tax=Saccharomonospora amisosensis TaxID=1128677 RepID=A0A7X5ZPZ9_9PSEU|nr:DUF2207 domain-containing protein [Saccharomonospora amisosensis]NIJ11288.1 hypothetical protein [Saccharomonospora amisosensis]